MSAHPVLPAFADLEASARLIVRSFSHAEHDSRGRPALVLDLGDVQVPTASGLGQLVALHNRLRASGGRLVLSNVKDSAYHVFEVTCLTRLMEIRRGGLAGA